MERNGHGLIKRFGEAGFYMDFIRERVCGVDKKTYDIVFYAKESKESEQIEELHKLFDVFDKKNDITILTKYNE